MDKPAEAHGCHEDEPLVIIGQGAYREEEYDAKEGMGAIWWLLFAVMLVAFFALAFVDRIVRGLA